MRKQTVSATPGAVSSRSLASCDTEGRRGLKYATLSVERTAGRDLRGLR